MAMITMPPVQPCVCFTSFKSDHVPERNTSITFGNTIHRAVLASKKCKPLVSCLGEDFVLLAADKRLLCQPFF